MLDFVSKLVASLAWPVTLLLIIVFFRKPLKNLLPFLERLKFKDLELSFRRQVEDVLQSAEIAETSDTNRTIAESVSVSPRASVLEAWHDIEKAAEQKLKELEPKMRQTLLGPDGALGHLEYRGALTPKTKKTLLQLRALRNQASRAPDSSISAEAARGYVLAANSVQKQIDSLTAIPQFKLTRLTLLILEYNHLLDTQKYDYISISDVHREIKNGSVLRYIAKEAAGDADLSLYLDERESRFERQYAEQLKAIYDGYAGRERKKWGVENLGLCLLIAWTNEIIQTGSGWYPNEDLKGTLE